MKLKNALKIKKLFLTGDYLTIKYLIMRDKNIKLSGREIKILAGYALDKNDQDLMFELFGKVDYNTRKNFIRRIYSDKNYAASSSFFTVYFNEFLTVGLEINNAAILYHLAVICSRDYEHHTADTFILNGYFNNCDDFNLIVAVSHLEHFNTVTINEKIMAEKPELIGEHILNLPINEINSFVTKYLSYEPDITSIYTIASILRKCEEASIKFIHAIILNDIPSNPKSSYLLAVFKNHIESKLHKELIKEILKLKDFETIKELMTYITKEEQNKYCDEALRKNDLSLIVILASTTDCYNTSKLIDYILNSNNMNSIAYMITNLRDKYLNDTLNSILNFKGKVFYLELIEHLNNSNVDSTPLINYLCQNNLLCLYNIEMATYLQSLLEDTGPERK